MFDNFIVHCRAIVNFNASEKLYLYVCMRTNGIRGILIELFYYSSSQYMMLI